MAKLCTLSRAVNLQKLVHKIQSNSIQLQMSSPPTSWTPKTNLVNFSPPNPRSAFFLFASDKRPKLKQENPSATVGEIAKQLGAAWKVMTDEQKKPYQKLAKEKQETYASEMAAYKRGEYAAAKTDEEDEEEEFSDED